MPAEDRISKILNELKTEEELARENSANSGIKQTVGIYYRLARFWYQFLSVLLYIWSTYFQPVYSFGYKIFRWVFWNKFRFFWDKLGYKTNAAGEKKFSKPRGALIVLAGAAYLVFLYHFVFFAANATLYFATVNRDEIVYLANAQEIDASRNLHSVQGCVVKDNDEAFSCSEEDSLYFRIEPTPFNHVWSLINRTNFFLPDYIAAPIAPGWQECVVTSYGVRLKFFVRGLDIYPHLLSASCRAMPNKS